MMKKIKGRWIAVLIALVGCALTALLALQDTEEAVIEIASPVLAVETLEVKKTDYRLRIPAWGFVEAQETIDIRPEVAGRITTVSAGVFNGGKVKRGALLFSIDARAYENTLAEAKAAHEQARQALAIEEGRQTIASSEWKLLEGSNWGGAHNKSLALREPQLKTCRSAVQMALARQSQAELDVERTRLTAPCDGMIIEENIAKGQLLDIGDVALRLACTDSYQVMASFSAQYVLDPDVHAATLDIGSKRHRGVVKAVLPRIDPQTRQKQALVAFNGERVVLRAYVSLTLPGPLFKNCTPLPKAALRPGDSVWVLGKNNTLDIRPVKVLGRDPFHAVIGDGLAEDDRVILSHIASPLQDMPLRATESVAQEQRNRGAQNQ